MISEEKFKRPVAFVTWLNNYGLLKEAPHTMDIAQFNKISNLMI
jgi:hypothetical protein